MSGFPVCRRGTLRALPLLLCATGLTAQTCLVLSPPALTADGTAQLDISLYSSRGTPPAAVQWTLEYPRSIISRLSVDDGPALASAGKTVICAGDAAAYHCLVVGANRKAIANGSIAKITAWLVPDAAPANIQMTNPLAVSAEGYLVHLFSRMIPPTGATISSDCRLHPPPKGWVGK